MNNTIEIRSYNLLPDTRERFHRLMRDPSLPMLQRWNIDVVAFGASPHDATSYYLIRRFDSIQDLEQQEDAFYSSAEWRQGPREAILACIENFTSIVLTVDDQTLSGLRQHIG